MRRTLVVYGLLLPVAALLVFMAFVPEEASTTRWEARYYSRNPAIREPMLAYFSAADTLRAYGKAVVTIDSRERARSVASHRSGLLVRGDSGISASTTAEIRSTALAELEAIGASAPRYPVAVIAMIDTRVTYPRFQRAVVLPEQAGAPCVVIMRISSRFPKFTGVGNTDRLLGTCGFYAAYGAPSAGMRAWLLETRLTAAGFLQRPASHGDGSIDDPSEANAAAGSGPDMVACRAGRIDGCERLFTQPHVRGLDPWNVRPVVQVIPEERGILVTHPLTFNAPRTGMTAGLLSSIAYDLGAERFTRLWTSDAPPARAFAEVTGRPVSAWISERVTTVLKVYHAGPSLTLVQWLSMLALLGAATAAGLRFSRPHLT